MKSFFVSVALLFVSTNILAQDLSKLMRTADDFFKMGSYYEAIPIYREVLMYDNSTDAKEKLAHAFREVGNFEKAEYWYEKVIPLVPTHRKNEYYFAQVLHSRGKYEEAKEWYLKYSDIEPRCKDLADACANVQQFYKNQNDFNLSTMPYNTSNDDMGAVYFKEGIVYSTSGNPKEKANKMDIGGFMDMYFSKTNGKKFTAPERLKGINTPLHEGPATFNRSGNEVFFTQNTIYKSDEKKKRQFKIVRAELGKKNKWEVVEEFIENNADYNVMHPTLSADGTKLFFVSDKPGGYGGKDIYMISRRGDIWGEPVNLGGLVNTIGDEMFPFLHIGGELFFSSNGHPGLGGYDLFVTTQDGVNWQKPENIGAPFNSPQDDLSYSMDDTKNRGYFASKRDGGKGGLDIYTFSRKKPLNYTPPKITTPSDDLVIKSKEKDEESNLNIKLQLNPIAFEFKQENYSSRSKGDLNRVVKYLKENPQAKLSIESHTDARGEAIFNLELSQERAQLIKDYLIENGVENDRIKAIGYGANVLVNKCDAKSNCPEELHAANRRIVFNVQEPQQLASVDNEMGEEVIDFSKTQKTDSNVQRIEKVNKNKSKKKTKKPSANKKKTAKEKSSKKKKPQPKKTSTKKSKSSEKDKTKKVKTPKKDIPKEPKVVVIPRVGTTERTTGFTFRVNVGPYKELSPELVEAVEKLNITPTINRTKTGEIIRIGMFGSIYDSEQVEKYMKSKGFKAQIEVFVEGQPSKMKIKTLKKQGVY